MVFQIAVVIIIPLILGIATVAPFDEYVEEKPIDANTDSELGLFYFFMMLIWFFFLFRILFQLKKGTFNLKRKF